MSYLRAEDILPRELIETIQQYVNGKTIYIPSIAKKEWGSETDTRKVLQARNAEIRTRYQSGCSTRTLADEYALSVKSIQRILREKSL